MKITGHAPALAAGLLLFGVTATADAASLFFIPTAATQNVVDGDIVSFEIHMDFSDEPTLGGGFNVFFDSSALAFVSFYRDESIGDPNFSRDPDILDGSLENWGIGAFEGLPHVAVLGNVVFQVLPAMGRDTTIRLSPPGTLCGCWIGTDFVTVIDPDYGTATVSRVPLPAAVWSMLSGLGFLFAFRRAGASRL